jgi:hypothetical protein
MKPRITPLPGEPQGEGIAYSRDGTEFLTTSDQPKTSTILRYTPYAPPAPPAPSATVQAQGPKAADRSFLDSLSLRDLTRIVIGIGVLGMLMIAVGVFAVIRSRRSRALLITAEPVPAAGPPGETADADVVSTEANVSAGRAPSTGPVPAGVSVPSQAAPETTNTESAEDPDTA